MIPIRLPVSRLSGAIAVAALLISPIAASAQAPAANPGWFVPAQGAPAAAPGHAGRSVRRQEAPPPAPEPVAEPDQSADGGGGDGQQAQEPMPDLPQPPVPALSPVAKGTAPPAAVIGVLAVPDVMRQSSAAQAVQKVIGERRDILRQDAEREQQSWRELQQQLQADAPKLTPEQGRGRERELRDRITTDQKALRARNKIIQEAAQVSLSQIERTLIAVIRQVAESRGMNLVLHRSQVALNVNEFDITDAVVQQLNKVLPTVMIPSANVDPATLPKDWGTPPAPVTPVAAAAPPAKAAPPRQSHALSAMETVADRLGDPRFYRLAGPHTLAAVADAARASAVVGAARDAPIRFSGVAALPAAGRGQVSFLHSGRYAAELRASEAGAVILAEKLADRLPEGMIGIVTPDPYAGWARVAALFHPPEPVLPGVHPSAVLDESARIDPSAEIGPYAVIGARAEIGADCRIGPHTVIGAGVVLGRGCQIGPHVSIRHALLGDRVCVLSGARIGEEGFGFAPTPQGFLPIPQLGRVILGDDVAVGANTAIDRGAARDTVIGAGTRLDNLVQIGHNVRIGRACVLAAQVGISGSAELEDYVQIAGQAGFAGHLRIGKGARIGGQAGIMSDVPPGAEVVGSPALPLREFFRTIAVLRRLARRDGGIGSTGQV